MPFGSHVLRIEGRNSSAMGKAKQPPRDDSGLGKEVQPEMQGDFREQLQKEAASEVIGICCHHMTRLAGVATAQGNYPSPPAQPPRVSQCFLERGGFAAFHLWPCPYPLHNLQTSHGAPGWNWPHLDFRCLSALVCHTAGEGGEDKPRAKVWKQKNPSAQCFQGTHQAGRISEAPKKLLSPPNLNTCSKTHEVCQLVLCLRNASC